MDKTFVVCLSQKDVTDKSDAIFVFKGMLAEQARIFENMCWDVRQTMPAQIVLVFVGASHYNGLAQMTLSYLGYENVSVVERSVAA